MKWKLFFRNLSVSAPQVTVRTRLPWYVRMLLAFLSAVIAAAAGIAIYEYGRNFGGPGRQELLAEVDNQRSQLREVTAERDRNAAQAMASESELKVQKAAQEQLVQQVGTLEAEVARLQADLSFFESLLPAGKSDKGVVIRSFRMQPDADLGHLTYRLLVQQSGKPDKDFVGSVQLKISCTQGGRALVVQVPDDEARPEELKSLALGFRHYQRVEGGIVLPAGAVAHSVQVRILAGGDTRLQQTFNL